MSVPRKPAAKRILTSKTDTREQLWSEPNLTAAVNQLANNVQLRVVCDADWLDWTAPLPAGRLARVHQLLEQRNPAPRSPSPVHGRSCSQTVPTAAAARLVPRVGDPRTAATAAATITTTLLHPLPPPKDTAENPTGTHARVCRTLNNTHHFHTISPLPPLLRRRSRLRSFALRYVYRPTANALPRDAWSLHVHHYNNIIA